MFYGKSWWTGRTTSPSSSPSLSGSSVGSRLSPSMDLERRRAPVDLVWGIIVAGEVELGPPAGHGRRPLLVQHLLLQISGWRGSCAAQETKEGGPWSDPWPWSFVVSSRGAPQWLGLAAASMGPLQPPSPWISDHHHRLEVGR